MEHTVTPTELPLQVDIKEELYPAQTNDATPTPSPPLTARQIRLLQYTNYQRHPKPPYSYVGIIVHAIHSSSDKCLTLAQIKEKMSEMFEFFRGEYDGWKDSVRHNLSHNACFVKSAQSGNMKSKGSLWSVDLSKVPSNAFKRQENNMARKGHWAYDLHVQLGVPEIFLPPQSTRFTFVRDHASTSPSVESPSSDSENVWHERRINSPFLSDSSMEGTPKLPRRARGPIRLRRANARRAINMNESSKQRLIKLITECAELSNISHDDAIHNLSQLCMSADLSQATPSSTYVSSSHASFAAGYQTTPPIFPPYSHGSPYNYLGQCSTPSHHLYPAMSHPHFQGDSTSAHMPSISYSQPHMTSVRYSPPDVTSSHQFSPVTPPSPRASYTTEPFGVVQAAPIDFSAQEKNPTDDRSDKADFRQEDNSTIEISYACL